MYSVRAVKRLLDLGVSCIEVLEFYIYNNYDGSWDLYDGYESIISSVDKEEILIEYIRRTNERLNDE